MTSYRPHLSLTRSAMKKVLFAAVISITLVCHNAITANAEEPDVSYGTDISFPMHYAKVSDNYPWLPHNVDPSIPTPDRYKDMPIQPLGDRQKFYDDMMQGCRDRYGGRRCETNEEERVAMSLRQPQSMTNYTDVGFKKIKAPKEVFDYVKKFWDKNKKKRKEERWPAGNTYTNHWASPTEMVSVEDTSLRGGGSDLKKHIWDAARDTIEEWTGQELTECSLYGIRVYNEGAVLSTHVDRLPLVSSAIINVDQDVDEPWPLEVIGHDGKAHNVTMEPGDMVLYESHAILHGRPYPLKGRYFANIFVHFEPKGHSLRHNAKMDEKKDVNTQYKKTVARRAGGHEVDAGDLPPYIVPGTPEERNWRKSHPHGYRASKRSIGSFTTGSTEAHSYAQHGDMDGLMSAVESKGKHIVNAVDENGWTPFHEAVRAGHEDAVKYLFENGAEVNKRTHMGEGGTALYLAHNMLGRDHVVTKFLESVGGEYIEPEL